MTDTERLAALLLPIVQDLHPCYCDPIWTNRQLHAPPCLWEEAEDDAGWLAEQLCDDGVGFPADPAPLQEALRQARAFDPDISWTDTADLLRQLTASRNAALAAQDYLDALDADLYRVGTPADEARRVETLDALRADLRRVP